MKSAVAVVLCLALASSTAVQAISVGAPLGKVIEMLTDLEAKVKSEGEASKKLFEEKTEFCKDGGKQKEFEIKTGKSEVAELKASIDKSTSQIASSSSDIERLSGEISANEGDLAAATKIRESESTDFAAESKELQEIIGTLERAIAILQREMNSGASMLQLKNAKNMVQVFSALVQASVFSSADASRLTALVQSTQQADDGDSDATLGAPAAAVYTSQSGGIVDTLQDLLEKAETQLADSQKKEATSQNNFEMLKQSVTDEIKFANKDLSAAKAVLATSSEEKATAEGDLAVTSKSLEQDITDLEALKKDCMTFADNYNAEVASRAEELKAIAKAIEVLQETMPKSFLQLASHSSISSRSDLINFEAVRFVRDLARKQGSTALTQLASRMASAIRFSQSSGADPFAKVKGLISDMVAKLESERSADDSHKAWCDEEIATTTAKKDELQADVEKLTTKIDATSAKAAKLKEEVAALQKELADLAEQQSEMTAMRQAAHTKYTEDKAESSTAIQGIKSALSVLREYYATEAAHDAAEGAGSSIISLLEVCESDFAKSLAEMEVTETQESAAYDKFVKEAAITKAMKEQDVKYKSKEAASLDKARAEHSSDLETVQEELSGVLASLDSITKQCTYKVEPYAERKARREAEIAGLKEALTILEEQTVLLQKKSRRSLRGNH